jgi:hypothetical protein
MLGFFLFVVVGSGAARLGRRPVPPRPPSGATANRPPRRPDRRASAAALRSARLAGPPAARRRPSRGARAQPPRLVRPAPAPLPALPSTRPLSQTARSAPPDHPDRHDRPRPLLIGARATDPRHERARPPRRGPRPSGAVAAAARRRHSSSTTEWRGMGARAGAWLRAACPTPPPPIGRVAESTRMAHGRHRGRRTLLVGNPVILGRLPPPWRGRHPARRL